MAEKINTIIDLLQKHLGVYRKLLDLVRHERDALVAGDLKRIEEITFGKEALISTLRKYEQERISAAQALALTLGLKPDQIQISCLVEQIQESDQVLAERLRSVGTALRILIERVSEQNQANWDFIEGSIGHIRKMRENVLTESMPHTQTYNKKGKKSIQRGPNQFLSEEA